jgi:hypothetical protein
VSGTQRQLLQEHAREIGSCQDKDLRESLTAGVGFHHGSIAPHDRRVVENLFLKRALIWCSVFFFFKSASGCRLLSLAMKSFKTATGGLNKQ